MSKHSCLLSISVLAGSAVACSSPGPSNTSADGGSDAAVIPPITASNTVTRADLATGIAPLMVPGGATFVFDTDQGAMYDAGGGNLPIRIAGPGVQDGVFFRTDDQNRAFFAVQSVMLGERAILRGVGKRALILIAEGPVEIHGLLDVSAGHCSLRADEIDCAGPGGGRGGNGTAAPTGCSPGQVGASQVGAAGGSGGGGFASPGGAGGAGGASVPGGAGGLGTGCPGPALDPLEGGSGGNAGGGLGPVRFGGGGGGAVQVTSYASIALASPAIASIIGEWAGGGGGGGGAAGGSGPIAGGGGGAGGAILLEAPTIEVRPGVVLAANGGGGGAGAFTADGQAGQLGSTPASGGAGSSGVAGGAGAARNASAVDGAIGVNTAQSSPAGGGGGGGLGRIRINAIVLNVSDQAVLSPSPSTNILPSS